MTIQTQGLDIREGVGLRKVGKAANGSNVIGLRGLVRDASSAFATAVANTE